MRMPRHYLSMPANKWTARINWQVRKANTPNVPSKIAKALGNNIDGTPVSYKVYMTSDVNERAKNCCVRVYSGLMDLMTG